MSRFNKILLSGTALLMAVSVISPVSAEGKKEASSDAGAIIFRIENIKPIADKDGLINKCNFVVTAFNRMNKGVREAKLNFQWQDNISAKYAAGFRPWKAKILQTFRLSAQIPGQELSARLP